MSVLPRLRDPLPPIKLKQRNNPSKHREIAIIAFAYMVLSVATFIGVCIATSDGSRDLDDCHNDTSLSATETRFQIDPLLLGPCPSPVPS